MVEKKSEESVDKDLESINFEQALKELEDIVGKLENGDLELENCLKSFERGTKLLHLCEGKLNQTARKLEILRKTGDNKAEFQEFEPNNG
jgi:exodeoxyribonuclease VII small subunit